MPCSLLHGISYIIYFAFSSFLITFVGKKRMTIVLQYKIKDYLLQKEHAWAKIPIQYWCMVARASNWRNLGDIRKVFPKTDMPGQHIYVFSLSKGKNRLLLSVIMKKTFIYIIFIGTYEEYCLQFTK